MDLYLECAIIFIFLQLPMFTKTANSVPNIVFHKRPEASFKRWSPATDIQCGDFFPKKCQKSIYQTFDGSCNNQNHSTWAMGFTRYSRLLPADYADGIISPRVSKSGRPLPLARTLSYVFSPDIEILDENFTLAAMQYGQIIAHDLTFPDIDLPTEETECCTIDGQLKENVQNKFCYPIIIPDDDPVYTKYGRKCLRGFTPTNTDFDRGCNLLSGSAEQLTIVSGFLDLSQLYGSNPEEAASLRESESGRLIAEKRSNKEWPPIVRSQYGTCNGTRSVCYKSGDWRVNQNPQLTVLQIILFREHNRVADILAKLNPHWEGEKIFQEARKIVIAEYQHISYDEWLPIFLGVQNSFNQKMIYQTKNLVKDYNPFVNPSVSIEFATVAFRFFHTFIAGNINLVDELRYSFYHLRLSDHLDNPAVLEKNHNFDDLARGLCTQAQEAADQYHDKEITNFMSRGFNKLGEDLRAMDIHRSRERGIASYNNYRVYCGLRKALAWQDFLDYISPENVEKLSQLYQTPDDVDLGVGAILEKLVHKTLVGPTILCILNEQFFKTRAGDRFWYENENLDSSFSIEKLNEIRKASISRLMCDNSNNIKFMQLRGFVQISEKNPLVKCDEIPSIDFSLWEDPVL